MTTLNNSVDNSILLSANSVAGNTTGSAGNVSSVSSTNIAGIVSSPTIQQFTSGAGTYTPTSSTIAYIIVEMVGGGGGGGGYALPNHPGVGGGGGGGGYLKALILSPTPVSYSVGAGGTAGDGATGGNGGTGGTTSFSALSCTGGQGGQGTGNSGFPPIVYGGTGGTASGGFINITGGTAQAAYPPNDIKLGQGASSVMCSNQIQPALGSTIVGATGLNYGGGGNGAWASALGGNVSGGQGGPGIITVYEYYI